MRHIDLYVAETLCALWGNTYAIGTVGYATNILVAVTMILMAIVFAILFRMEHGIPQAKDSKADATVPTA